jgi:hypothetical protein
VNAIGTSAIRARPTEVVLVADALSRTSTLSTPQSALANVADRTVLKAIPEDSRSAGRLVSRARRAPAEH